MPEPLELLKSYLPSFETVDEERLALQLVGGFTAGRQLLRGNMPTPEPTPYIPPKTKVKPLSPSTAEVLDEGVKPQQPAASDQAR